ncbi:MAG TPA: DUF1150 family protein [Micavibrio sp.]|jgi:hypothetical protein|nr:DUF1150 family protein [Micavibrio sp.]
MNDSQENIVRNLLAGLSPRDFLKIGMDEIAYVRPILVKGVAKPVYGVYAADGTQLSVLDSMDMAIATMRHNDLLPVTLH